MGNTKNKNLIVDIDAAIKCYNEKHPGEKIDRYKLAEKLGKTYQSLTNYQGGMIPKAVETIDEIIKITGVKYSDLIKEKENGVQ